MVGINLIVIHMLTGAKTMVTKIDKVMIKLTGYMDKCHYELFKKSKGHLLCYGQYRIPTLIKDIGTEKEWPEFGWPPVKVTVTIEEE
jgi:hypothetical protein